MNSNQTNAKFETDQMNIDRHKTLNIPSVCPYLEVVMSQAK